MDLGFIVMTREMESLKGCMCAALRSRRAARCCYSVDCRFETYRGGVHKINGSENAGLRRRKISGLLARMRMLNGSESIHPDPAGWAL